jgi:hypothetical protein
LKPENIELQKTNKNVVGQLNRLEWCLWTTEPSRMVPLDKQFSKFSNRFGFRFMVFNTTFNNISAIPWRSALLVEETGVFGENH